jgi:hypothetical protein
VLSTTNFPKDLWDQVSVTTVSGLVEVTSAERRHIRTRYWLIIFRPELGSLIKLSSAVSMLYFRGNRPSHGKYQPSDVPSTPTRLFLQTHTSDISLLPASDP